MDVVDHLLRGVALDAIDGLTGGRTRCRRQQGAGLQWDPLRPHPRRGASGRGWEGGSGRVAGEGHQEDAAAAAAIPTDVPRPGGDAGRRRGARPHGPVRPEGARPGRRAGLTIPSSFGMVDWWVGRRLEHVWVWSSCVGVVLRVVVLRVVTGSPRENGATGPRSGRGRRYGGSGRRRSRRAGVRRHPFPLGEGAGTSVRRCRGRPEEGAAGG